MTTKEKQEIITLEQYLELKEKGFEFEGQSYLFWEYVRVLKEVKPKYFLLENVKMSSKWQKVITNTLGVEPILINSSLVSAQNRPRLYWTNIPNVEQPKDKNIKLDDIIEKKHKVIKLVPFVEKKLELIKGKFGYIPNKFNPYNCSEITDKSPCLTAQGESQTKSSSVIMYDENLQCYTMLSVTDWENLQTLPNHYTYDENIPDNIRKNLIGNCWTVDVIAHIFSYLKE